MRAQCSQWIRGAFTPKTCSQVVRCMGVQDEGSRKVMDCFCQVHEHIGSVATPCQTASYQTRDSEGKPGAMKASWPGLMERVSAIKTRDSEVRAVVYSLGINDDRNCSFILPGREQTNNRAELAVITAMQVHDGNLEIRSDSEYVVRIATSRSRGGRKATRVMLTCRIEDTAETQQFKTSWLWVKGHATKVHIDRQITSLNKGGNDAADALASAAAFHAPQSLTDAIDRRTAWDTHNFAAELLVRRRVALLALRPITAN